MKKTFILAVILLIVLAVSQFFGRGAVEAQQGTDSAQTLPENQCSIRTGCKLPDGSVVQTQGKLSAQTPFTLSVSGLPPAVKQVYVSFSMADMDMGFNRYRLLPPAHEGGAWQAENIRLPVCVVARKDYLADIHIDNQVYRIAFDAD